MRGGGRVMMCMVMRMDGGRMAWDDMAWYDVHTTAAIDVYAMRAWFVVYCD